MIGETVTHYRIVDKLGEGGMGVVYRAEDTRLGRQVAVKFLSPKLMEDPLAIERFQREAWAASALNHPHICALYDIGKHNGVPFIVMELLEGRTLRRRINGTPLPLDLFIEYGCQAADALDAAHSIGMIHRDIKSANIFVTERGQVKVLDFGLAKLTMGASAESDPYANTTMAPPVPQATQTGQTIGTLTYMSPEQARGEELDQRSDLFSFGVVLYEMATGREPFGGRTPALIFDAILRQHPPRPSELNSNLPHELDNIILKALEKDRDLRYQRASDLRADLRRLKRDSDAERATTMGRAVSNPASVITAPASAPAAALPSAITTLATPATPVAAASGPTATPTATNAAPRRRWLALGTALLAVVGAAATIFVLFGGGDTTIDSVAVLPFTTQGTAADTEYLTDGITESLINGLAQLPNLRVSARSVVFRFKGKDVDAQQVGRDLNVKAVVTGRVAVRGDRIVIQSELMNIANGAQLWGDRYDRPQADLLAVQQEIAEEILDKVQPRLSGDERRRATKTYTASPEAYQIYLQGRYHWNKGTIEGYKRSIEYFQQAISKDPRYALAYAGLADAYLSLGSYWVEAITEARAAALQAIETDSTLAEAHVALGRIKLLLDWDWAAAASEFQQGISLNPSSALAHNQYAAYLATLGRTADALVEVRRAQELDPLSPIVNADLGWYLLYAGQNSDAVAQFRKTLEFDATSVSAHRGLGIALSLQGQHAEAATELRQALKLSENSPVILGSLGAALARAKDRAGAEGVLRDLTAMAAREYVPSSAPAVIHAALGDTPKALDALEKAYEEHDFAVPQIVAAPWYQDLRSEPRFTKLVERLGLPTGTTR